MSNRPVCIFGLFYVWSFRRLLPIVNRDVAFKTTGAIWRYGKLF